MKQRPGIYYTETDKALMWDRWQKDESLDDRGLPRDMAEVGETVTVVGWPARNGQDKMTIKYNDYRPGYKRHIP